MNKPHALQYSIALLAALVAVALTIPTAQAANGPDPAKEKELLATLRSDGPEADKALACKHLAVHGSKDAVADLAKLLSNERLASWSRIALEVIPGPEADEALRESSKTLNGRLLVGVLNSLGVRRDAGSVELLTGRLKDQDADVASAAAVALGRVGNDVATQTLRQSLSSTSGAVRTAVAEGCILCAERLMADGKANQAAEIYDEVRRAEVPKQKKLEAIRGAILSRKAEGIPLLLEQLRSEDRGQFRLGLTTAREIPGQAVSDALANELSVTTPDKAALFLTAIADRRDATIPSAVLEAAKRGPKQIRVAAIDVIGRLGDVESLPTLLEIGADSDADVAQSAKSALAGLPGEKVNAEIVARLVKADNKELPVLIEVVGQRRIEATPALVKAIDHNDAAVRSAALTALGTTVGAKELPVLIKQVVAPKHADNADVARKALRAACVRMPDREACADQVVAALSDAPVATKTALLEILGDMGGPKALATLASAVKGNNAELQDTGSRMLGEWMTVDAAPVLLDLAKTAPGDKYQVRALRGYIRLARQFTMPDAQRAEMCQKALEVTNRIPEQQLVLTVLQRYPSRETFDVALKAKQVPALKDDATQTVLTIVQKLGNKAGDPRELLAKASLDPMKVEVVKAEYGAGATQKDVTEALQRQVGELPLISLPAPSYTASFGGDPVPGTPKQLKVQYKINGKSGEATFAENSLIVLPMPK